MANLQLLSLLLNSHLLTRPLNIRGTKAMGNAKPVTLKESYTRDILPIEVMRGRSQAIQGGFVYHSNYIGLT